MADQRIRTLLSQLRYLRGLPEESVDALAARFTHRRYEAGAVIFLEGDPVSGLFVVESGIVKISRLSQQGREHILVLIHPGDSFNDVAALDGGPNPATATAHTDVDVWHTSRVDLQRVAQRHPALAWALVEDLAIRARYLVGLVEDLSLRSVRGRLARLLMAEAEAAQSEVVPRMLTQEDMAARVGTVREMIGRTLRSMEAEGIIQFDRHRIVILDPERLASEMAI